MHAVTTRPLAHRTVVVPRRHAAPAAHTTHATYLRRRVAVSAFLAALALSLGVAVQHGLADRGGDPASASAIGHSTSATYVVHSGDTLWEIGARLHPGGGLADYVDALIALNGGSTVVVEGQVLRLP